MSKERPRLIIADDHQLVVEALRSALEPTCEVVAVVHDSEGVLTAATTVPADCLLLDLSLPGRNGLELLPDLRRLAPELPVIIVTMHVDRALAETALASGARGFVPKDAGLDELQVAIRNVLNGKVHVWRELPQSTYKVALHAAHAGLAQLTPRQHDIITLIGEGKTSPEIATALGLSQRTVAFHRTNIRQKLGIDSEKGLLRLALLMRMGTDEVSDEPTPTAS